MADILKKTSEFDNFVLSTGCDLPPHVQSENISAFFEALDNYNVLTEEKQIAVCIEGA